MAALEEIGALLQSLQALKPPGVTKTKIDAITAKCVENVQSDATIVQKIAQQYKNSPVTHKLGVVYVLDSVTRQWMEKARASGQAVSKNAAPGTFASGVQKVTEALPGLMSDLIHTAPDNQKEKISKLLDIWERGQTFPQALIADLKQQLKSPKNNSYTPPGSPPKGVSAFFPPAAQANQQPVALPAPAAAPSTFALLAALAEKGQNGHANPAPAPPAFAVPPIPYAQNVAPPPPPFVPTPAAPAAQAFPPQPTGGNDMIQQIIGAIAAGLIPQDQAMAVLTAIAQAQQGPGAALLPPQQPGVAPFVPQQPGAFPFVPTPPQPPVTANIVPAAANGNQQNGHHLDRYDQSDSRYRDRSRSPDYGPRGHSPDRRTPPNRRDSPTYGVYDPNARADTNFENRNERDRGRGRGRQRGRGRDEYRQRTPPRRQPSPGANAPRNGQEKFIDWDSTLPRDHIKVLSRTLFVGGAGGTEGEIRSIFSRFGRVQTCIVNQEKRHAFVKMVNRQDAIAAKEGMDNLNDPIALSKARQTRWGVGFGPRDCSDYNTGISVIPISRLTDADRKWVVQAEYGGTGGRALEGGMVIEEPDIEIGAGVSSKAISRRMGPEPGRGRGGHGPRGGGFDHGSRFRKQDRPAQAHEPRHVSPRPEPSVAVPPAVPGFGFQLPHF